MKISMRILAILLAALLIMPFTACSEPAETGASENETTAAPSNADETESTAAETEYVDTRFDGVNFNGRELRISTSIDATDATNANALIEGTGELNGDLVNDAVYYRNLSVEELLGIDLVFEQSNYSYGNVAGYIKPLVMAGEDAFGLFVNDLYPICGLIADALFVNISGNANFDRTKAYWYDQYMKDLQIIDGYEYVMAGDYFTDVIASAHALYYNKNIINNMFGDPDLIYKDVIDGKWTMDRMVEIVSQSYVDLNGNSKVDTEDQYGYTSVGMWGPMIPFVIGCDVEFIDRASGSIEFAFNNEHSVKVLEKLNEVFYSEGSYTGGADAAGIRNTFANGMTVIVGYQRLGDLANMRDIDFEIGIIPYPKLDEAQENYVTSTHDTTEIGVIPTTASDVNFVTTCVEVLNRETEKQVIPQYYETALKVKYTRDELSAQMIDIIHDNFGSSFALGYGVTLSNFMLSTTFSTPLGNKSTDFVSAYEKASKGANKILEKLLAKMQENCVAK